MFENFDCASADEVKARAVSVARRKAEAHRLTKRCEPAVRPQPPVVRPPEAPYEPPAGYDWGLDANVEPGPQRVVRLADIIDATCKALQVSRNDLLSERRTRTIVPARQACMWVMRAHTRASLPKIGRRLYRDHGTVHHGIETVKASPDLKKLAALIVKQLGLPPIETMMEGSE